MSAHLGKSSPVTAGGKTTTTSTCGLPDVTDFIYVLAAVALLLLPDAINIGSDLINQARNGFRETKDILAGSAGILTIHALIEAAQQEPTAGRRTSA